MFSFYKTEHNDFYNKLVELSRNIFFYENLKIKDEYNTRIILMFIHFSLIIDILKRKENYKFPQKIYDNFFQNIEYNLRELGFGDVAVNKKMKDLNKIFYDILLKIISYNQDKIIINHLILIKYLNFNDQNSLLVQKLTQYLENFYNFCFDLKIKDIIKGKINFEA